MVGFPYGSTKFAYDAVGTLWVGLSSACLHVMQVNGYKSDQGYATLLSKRPQDCCEMIGSLHFSKSQLG